MKEIELFLDERYVVQGVHVTGEQIRDSVIEANLLKGRLSKLVGGEGL